MLLGKWPAQAPASVWRSRTTWLQAVGSLLVPRGPRDWVQITDLIARTFPNGAIFLVLLFRFFFCVWYLCIYWCSHGWGWAGVGNATFGVGSFAKLLKHTQPCSLNPELTGMSSKASGFAPGEHLAQPYRCKNHRWPSLIFLWVLGIQIPVSTLKADDVNHWAIHLLSTCDMGL